jgi:hypothetical protein
MKPKQFTFCLMAVMAVLIFCGRYASCAPNPNPPASPVKLIFIHHSCGENWLSDWDGGLGIALQDNNYFVSDTNYGWGPDGIGDNTDIGHWWDWFRGSGSSTCLSALYNESAQHCDYSRLVSDPGGENEIIMFKSCYPNSGLDGNAFDPPASGSNPLRGQDVSSNYHTVGNAKGIYNDILEYFITRQDKLFVLITSPPQPPNDIGYPASNARALNNWLVNDWLDSYPCNNVAVFDFYNVLTSNGGTPEINDAGQASGNHHRYRNGAIEHIQTVSQDMAAYSPDGYDGHPTYAGNQKATEEFIDLLNIYYNSWKGTGPSPGAGTGNMITSDLWIRAVINTEEKGPVEAVWQKGGEDITSRGDRVIWGHFYASPSDVTWGSQNNPDLFVKIWFDVGGRVDVNFFHVSAPDIEVYSDYPYDGIPDEHGTTTMSRRYIRQYYENGQCHSEDKCEDGNPPSGYTAMGNPSGYSTINDLRIGSMINTVEKGPVDALWRLGGQDTTARGDQVVWGHFYACPNDVTWGSQNNPDLFVKIWFDVGGRVDVNFFHVSVPDIEVYSDFPDDNTFDQIGTTIMNNRYIRHEYWR